MRAHTRTTIWLGPDPEYPSLKIDIHTEDDMVAIETLTHSGDELEIFIQPELFGRIREVMDTIESRGK